MTKSQTHWTPRDRRTVTLRATTSTVRAQLDFPSALAVTYARQWLQAGPAQMGVDVLSSGIIRRALAVYMAHLNGPGIDPEVEARAVRSCCSSSLPDAQDRQAASERLEGHQKGHPMPTYLDVLHGPHKAAECVALTDRAEALAEQINLERVQRMAAGRKTAERKTHKQAAEVTQ